MSLKPDDILRIERDIVAALRAVYDPEIPVNIYDLGLIYEVDVEPSGKTLVRMTLTAPACPMADMLLEQVQQKVKAVAGVSEVSVELTFDPPWERDMITEEGKLELGML